MGETWSLLRGMAPRFVERILDALASRTPALEGKFQIFGCWRR